MDESTETSELSGEGDRSGSKFYVRSLRFYFVIGFCDSPQRAADLFLSRFARHLLPQEAFTVCERGFAWPLDTDALLFEIREGAAHEIG